MKKLFMTMAMLAAAVVVADRLIRKIEVKVVKQDADPDSSGSDAEPGAARAAGLRYGLRSETGLDVLNRLDARLRDLLNRNPHDTV